eukprot:4142555-Alexandrium_andersonii.AAC.1
MRMQGTRGRSLLNTVGFFDFETRSNVQLETWDRLEPFEDIPDTHVDLASLLASRKDRFALVFYRASAAS